MKNFKDLSLVLRSMESDKRRNTIFAFCRPGDAPPHSAFARNPVSALGRLKQFFLNLTRTEDAPTRCYEAVIRGEYVLVEFHMFLQNEHLLAKSRPQRSQPVARGFPRSENAYGILPASVLGHPPIDYEGLPRDEGDGDDPS